MNSWDTYKAKIYELYQGAALQVHRLSGREKMAFSVLALFLAVVLSYAIYQPLTKAFEEQAHRLEEAGRDMQDVTVALDRYFKLKRQKELIEGRFKEIEMDEGVRSLLVNIIESKAGIPNGQYEINSSDAREFGSGYEETPFRIKFTTVDYTRLVGFLTEIVSGQKPLILTRLEIRKRSSPDGSLDINLDVSAIRRIK